MAARNEKGEKRGRVEAEVEASRAILAKRVVELESQVIQFAARVDQLYRQRAGLIAMLRNIRKYGGVTERHWRSIDRILASGKWEGPGEDSGLH